MSHILDYLALVIMAAMAAVGYKRGFLEELGRLVGLVISMLVAMKSYKPVSSGLEQILNLDGTVLSVVTFLIIFFTLLMGLRMVTTSLEIFLLSKGIRWSNRALGLVFGGLKGMLAVLVALWIFDVAPNLETFDRFRERSTMYRHFSGYRQWIIASFGLEGAADKGEAWMKKRIEGEVQRID